MKKVLLYWKTMLLSAVIIYGSLIRHPHITLPSVHLADKWAHFLLYALLTCALRWELNRSRMSHCGQWIIAAVYPVFLGGTMEILQHFFFYPRTGDWFDWLADIIGVGIGLIPYLLWKIRTH